MATHTSPYFDDWIGIDADENFAYWSPPDPYTHTRAALDGSHKFIELCKSTTSALVWQYKALMRHFHYARFEEPDCSQCDRGESKCRSVAQSIYLILMFRECPGLPSMRWDVLPKAMRDCIARGEWNSLSTAEQRVSLLASVVMQRRWRYLIQFATPVQKPN